MLERLAKWRVGQLCLVEHYGAAHVTHQFGDPQAVDSQRVIIDVHDPGFYSEVVFGGSLGAAEAFIAGDWSCPQLTDLIRLLIVNRDVLEQLDSSYSRWREPLQRGLHALRRNSRSGSRRNIAAHYDLGNEFFATFLDETMMYSAAIFEHAEATLTEASTAKNDLICRKLQLGPEDHVIEIGTGWGGFALHAATRYGCRITTTTISRAQHEFATRRIAAAGLSDRVTILQSDYRDLRGEFDKLVSIEMIEAVGHRYLDDYFGQCSRLLKPTGAMAIQAITIPDHRYEAYRRSVDFIQKHIFPGGCLPSLAAMQAAIARRSDLQLVHAEDFTPHYARTLDEWRRRFWSQAERIRTLGMSDEFLRTWEYYFCYCEAAFRERFVGSMQLMWAKPGWRGNAQSGVRDAK